MIVMNNGQEIVFPNAEYICKSRIANIYKYGDLAIKVYDDDEALYPDRIPKEVFDAVSSVNVNALLKLRDCYSDFVELYDKEDCNEVAVTGFTYDYIEEEKVDMIDLPMEYTLNTIHEFDLLVKEFNKRGILLVDPKPGNSILTKDNLVIIDPDLFEINQSEEALRKNYEIANHYIMKKWVKEFPIIERYEEQELAKILFNDYEDNFNDNYYGVMKRRLKAKTPNELLCRKIGERI